MKHEIKEYHDIYDIRNYNFNRPSRYFKDACRFFLPSQKGVASEYNFFDYTLALFTETDKPDHDPDYVSASGSRYWYYPDGVIRGADHWGNGVNNCDWALKLKNGRTIYGVNSWDVKCLKQTRYGYARWTDFIQKTRDIEINGEPVTITFDNFLGHDAVRHDGKVYHRIVIENWLPEEDK